MRCQIENKTRNRNSMKMDHKKKRETLCGVD
jgi:hypothetical protein